MTRRPPPPPPRPTRPPMASDEVQHQPPLGQREDLGATRNERPDSARILAAASPKAPGPAAGPPPLTDEPALTHAGAVPSELPHDLPQTFFLGRYRVVDEIGVGGMASVHLARVDGPGGFQKWVAIKRIHPHLVEDDQFVDMFLDEARIAAGINHANVAQVFDLGKDDNTYWIAMEYLHGEPLREIMRRSDDRGKPIPPTIASKICADAAEGLHAAHQLRGRNGQLLNLVHRDVTPHNLFVTYDGYTKVVDFGIAKVVDRLASTRAGTLKGKLAYMSPEQVRGQEVDRRTDLFALGVVLWELTTGRRLFRMDTDLDTLEKVQACVVPRPSTLIPNYPTELERIVMQALARDADQRFQTGRDFSRALQRFLITQGTFVGPEDVGEYTTAIFGDRVAKRERYLEWAAEVTSTIDVDQLHAHQAELDSPAFPPPQPAPPQPSSNSSAAVQSSHHHRSDGQNSASASVVTSAPLSHRRPEPQDLAATSIMDEDEEIPTMVATRGQLDPYGLSSGAGPSDDMTDDELNATIALQQGGAAQEIRAAVQQFEQQAPAHGAALTPAPHAVVPQHHPPPGQARRGAIETKMSMPRPVGVTEWLEHEGEVSLQGPRSMAILMAIAVLSTLCVIGLGALVLYRVYRLPKTEPPATTTTVDTPSKAWSTYGREGHLDPRDPSGERLSSVAKSGDLVSCRVTST